MKKNSWTYAFLFTGTFFFLQTFVSAQPTYNWAKKIGNSSNDEGYSIALDASNNVYIMGKFSNTVDFDPGAGTYTLTVSSSGYPDIFFAKYNSSGNFLWAKNIGNTSAFTLSCEDMAVDAAGNIYLTGGFDGTTDFDPNAGVANLTSAGSNEIYYAKYNSSGNYVWAKSLAGAAGNDLGNAIEVDASGNVYITGYHQGVDFDPGAGVVNISVFPGYWAAFYAKYDLNGNYIWAKGIAANNANVQSENIDLDNSGNVFISGWFNYTIDFDPGAGVSNLVGTGSSFDTFFGKYDSNGNYVWAKSAGGTGTDNGNGIVVDANNNIYITGDFQSTADFNPGAGTNNLISVGGNDAYFAKYDSNGNYMVAGNMGSASSESGRNISIDASGNMLITGYFQGTADFDPGVGTQNLTAVGGTDIFFAKYDAGGNYLWAKGFGSSLNDFGNSLTLDASGYLYLTGSFQNTVDFDPNTGVVNLTSLGSNEAFFAKYYLCENFLISVSSNNVTCYSGNDGTATANPSGGSSPYTYIWNTTATTQTITSLSAGNYSVTVTSAEGCIANQTVSITQSPPVAANFTVTNVSCYGGNNGDAMVNVTTGVSPFTYQWDANAGNQTTQTASGLIAGNFSVTVTDNDGCAGTFSITITQPAILTSTITPTNVNCNGGSNGSANLSVSGGISPYTFSWSTGATTQNISNLASATYTVTITDNNGCIKMDNVFINQPALLIPNVTQTNVTCNSLCDGTATANPTGGTPPYVYQWLTTPNQTTQTATGLCQNSFNVIVTDNNNCVVVPTVSISQPQVLTVSVSSVDATCNNADGSATATISGGTTPYTYNWSNGNSTQTASNISAGNYSVNVTDANGCTAAATATVSVISTPQPICMITVDSISTYNQIAWEKPSGVPIDSFRIYREISSVYTPIATVPFSQLSFYTDTTNGVNPNITSYKYEISAIDSCGNESALSSFHQTMHLSVTPAIPPASYNLFWNDYIGVTVIQYVIMRDSSFTGWSAIDSVSFGNNAWTDTRTYLPADTISYYIRIDHLTGCVATIKNPQPMVTNLNSSRSNNYRATDSSVVSINSINEEFIISVFPNPSSGLFNLKISQFENLKMAELSVYNVYGECINSQIIKSLNYQIDLSKQSKGIYHLQVRNGNGIINKKIIIQ